MDPQVVQAVALVGILLCNIIVLTALVVVGLKISKIVSDFSEKGQKAISGVQKQIDEIASHVRPTVTNAQRTVTGVTDTVSSVQRSVKTAESIVKQAAAPAALAIFAARVLRINGMVVGALGFAAGLFAKQQMEASRTGTKRITLPPKPTSLMPTVSEVTERKTFDTERTPIVTVTKNGVTSEEVSPPVMTGTVQK